MTKRMEWASLLNTGRHGKPGQAEDLARPNYTIDADRITFSAPFRRLANKTQVHPLYDNDHLRHRLIHSAEVASVGRSLGMLVGHWLETQGEIDSGKAHMVAGIVHAACLAHDIGNPPFGHSGEESMSGWFAEKFAQGSGLFKDIPAPLQLEFTAFEGNAQGHRIVTRLEMYRGEVGMDLSHAVIGAFSKYPMSASTSAAIQKAKEDEGVPADEVKRHIYAGAKKFGFFEGERVTFAKTAQALGLIEETGPDGQSWWRRHPLVCLVEAADDICYNIVDLEDGFTAGDLSFDEVRALLLPLIQTKPNDDDLGAHREYEKISHFRAMAIGGAIWASFEAFKAHYDAIMAGQYSGELIDDSQLGEEFRKIRNVAGKQLFVAPRKTKLEVRGRNVIRRVLDGILPVFNALQACNWEASNLPEYEQKLTRALDLDLRGIESEYSALHVMADYVSGMTDRYAVEVAKLVSGT
ncbi:Deoxyguanosinetriphosphate triphosphohydrolase [Aliiroseovarius sp. xm-m-379]|uniref:dGTP triphosphohydrolase n=1 Tax=unclassified Aliiroseovarius TaxID=2623558 RepID=UPI0019DC9015|nr:MULTISPECIES: dNTP triphosphohydrolase [unclassified Aliiroseovarius]NRP13715.1 Deoxyguanosinetriphosphate triphosphohydrolase [Aliiroseovarius sp. xm-d-517]NRP24913.1 Deoxyguanosinetriphosphate triphosphohydrolase [Aliiroseovarius sp. xm-m-379]NRP31565.1 Deoxyguanosinetriphosphate triphosphohydrolase [Aliiroseovarius sp. xm-m-314]NRP33712.1 Deoxyguanosinetriphosphate triphosphohydrolase [Aliiroseovarius sp. xm-a-104]NRP41145.1 Deoxyguanosinetriphosphate triphosphohydrolase [Aliiroseovarius